MAVDAEPETLDDIAPKFTLGSGATDKRTAAITQASAALITARHAASSTDLTRSARVKRLEAYGHGLYFAEKSGVAERVIIATSGITHRIHSTEPLQSSKTGIGPLTL